MLNRPLGAGITQNPITDNPFVQDWDEGLSNFPINNDWLLLTGENFSLLAGDDFAFLG